MQNQKHTVEHTDYNAGYYAMSALVPGSCMLISFNQTSVNILVIFT